MEMIEVDKWLGMDAPPLDPATMLFKSKAENLNRPKCSGCLFKGQQVSVCYEACEVAMRAGLADCDDGVIYVAIPIDPRQLKIEGE